MTEGEGGYRPSRDWLSTRFVLILIPLTIIDVTYINYSFITKCLREFVPVTGAVYLEPNL